MKSTGSRRNVDICFAQRYFRFLRCDVFLRPDTSKKRTPRDVENLKTFKEVNKALIFGLVRPRVEGKSALIRISDDFGVMRRRMTR
ncbi:hypothetical protein RRG08_029140 [Elysia crispata]|uniref:Uncharacterized protein n=1 Tax=Elysia crispata TaxID=231223 RepID=A0AAE1CTD8_9GAST|nr:hypothetical protein RRG08_029140 [Elysia crispata]